MPLIWNTTWFDHLVQVQIIYRSTLRQTNREERYQIWVHYHCVIKKRKVCSYEPQKVTQKFSLNKTTLASYNFALINGMKNVILKVLLPLRTICYGSCKILF